MKKKNSILIILSALILSCGRTVSDDKKPVQTFTLKKITVDGFSFRVPSHYKIQYTDSLNRPGEGYILSDCAKMYFSGGGLGSGEIFNKDNYEGFTVVQDTSNNLLKMVAYKFDSVPHLEVHVAKLGKVDESIIFGKDNALSNHNYVFIFNAMTNMGYGQPTCMTKDEMESLIKEFMNGTIEN